MRTNQTNFATTQFRVLSDDQIERIFLAGLELLECPGTRVLEKEARALLAQAGATVNGDTVHIPAGLVREMLASVPPRVVVGNRNGERTLILEDHTVHYGTGSDCPFIIDAETGERRPFLKRDVEEAARIADACKNIDFLMSLGLTSDVPTYSYDRHQAAAMLRNSIKPLVLTAMSRDALSDIVEMYYLVRGGRDAFEINPGFIIYLEPTTPLMHGKAALEKLIFAAERRIPAIYTPGLIAGATAPVTLAGCLALGTAEFLAGMTVSQLKRRGAPLVMGGVLSSMDMTTTVFTYGSPEFHLAIAALSDIAHWLKIPMFSAAGCSDSKTFDQQAAVEAALSIMAAGLSGGNLIHDVGFLEGALIGAHEMDILPAEVAGMVKRFLSGVRVDDDTLALDVIRSVGPGGNFLAEEHTVSHLRQELWFPTLMDRTKYSAWKKAGAKTLGDRIRERMAEILATHKVPPLPDDVNAGIDAILTAADKKADAEQTKLV